MTGLDNPFTESLLEHPRLEFFLIDPGTARILRSNLAARDNLGLSQSQLNEKKISDIDCQFSEPEILEMLEFLVPSHGNQKSFFSYHRRADGSEYPVQVFSYSSDWQGQPAVVALVLDISSPETPARPVNREKFLQEIQAHGKIGAWQLSFPEQQFFWTEEVFRIHGLTATAESAIHTEEALNPYLPQSRERLRQYLDSGHDSEQSWDEEFSLATADEHKKRVRIIGHKDVVEGKVVGLFGTIQDLTELRQAQDDLNSKIRDYRQLVDTAPFGILQLDKQFNLLTINASGADLFQQTTETLTGTNYLQLVDPADRQNARQQLNQAATKNGAVFELRTRQKRVHAISAYPLLGREQDPLRLVIIYQDVTANRESATAIGASEKKYRFMVDSSPDMVILHDLQGRIVDANPTACRLLGYDRAELLNKNFTELDPDWFARHFGESRAPAADLFSGESTLQLAEGEVIPCEYHATIATLDSEPTVLNFIRDISARTERERHRKEMAARVQQSQKLESLGVLAGGIAHDFNNLLTSVLGNANLARSAQAKNEPVGNYLEKIETAAVRAGELCTQMLTYAGQGRFAIKKVDLNRLIIDMTRLLELAVSHKTVLKYQLTDGLPAAAIDASQIRQALMSLVINASEAIGETSGMVTINTGIMRADSEYLNETYLTEELAAGDYLFIEVSDNGTGMSPQVKELIFDPFFSTKFTGRGLGLAAVLGIVRSHEGALKVYSEQGRGTTFKMLLPTASIAKLSAGDPALPAPPIITGSVLIADDEESVATVTAQMVEAVGLRATIAQNGRECVDIYQRDPDSFTLVLLDLSMPELDGAETFRELRTINPSVQVILTSGFNEEDSAHRFSGKGLSGFLQKPYNLAELRKKITEVLNK